MTPARIIRNFLSAYRRAETLDNILTRRFEQSVPVEEYLLRASKGKDPLPDRAKCRELAHQLGVPSEIALKMRELEGGK